MEVKFTEAEKFLNSLQFKIDGFDLKQINQLAELSGLKPEKLKVVHVAGTNGKGSTASFVSSILREQGYRVGSYYSPHLLNIRERIRVNNKMVPEKDFARLVKWFRPFIEKMKRKPSYFEMLTAIAVKHFQDKKVDWVVAEVGMGGRLDATNILKGNVCVFTDISLEHTQFLGETISEIASEKAAIIKTNSTVIMNRHNKGFSVINKNAKEKKSTVVVPEFRVIESTSKGNSFELVFPRKIKNLRTSMLGDFQIENAALAASACLTINAGKKEIRNGLLKADWPGRMHIVKKKPLVVLDSAHNPDAMRRLMANMGIFKFRKLVVVFGALGDKDVAGMLGKLKYDTLIATTPENERAIAAEKIKEIAGDNTITSESVASAISLARKTASENDLILVCGSNYVVAEAMAALKTSSIASIVYQVLKPLTSIEN